MNTSPIFLAIRAISAEFAKRMYSPIVIIASAVLAVLLGVSIWLVTVSAWWWLLLAPLIFIALLFTFAAIVAGLVITFLKPKQTRAQNKEVKQFVDSLQNTSEAAQTPKFILLFRLIKDILLPGKRSLINEISSELTSLQPRLKAIINSFRNN